jgi:AbrB family looped-hinge helix DNA binding protein
MRATGIIRRMDELGRVVIPKEVRNSLKIENDAPLEIFTEDNDKVIFRKYFPDESEKIETNNNNNEHFTDVLLYSTEINNEHYLKLSDNCVKFLNFLFDEGIISDDCWSWMNLENNCIKTF